jgi:hypothetical protein
MVLSSAHRELQTLSPRPSHHIIPGAVHRAKYASPSRSIAILSRIFRKMASTVSRTNVSTLRSYHRGIIMKDHGRTTLVTICWRLSLDTSISIHISSEPTSASMTLEVRWPSLAKLLFRLRHQRHPLLHPRHLPFTNQLNGRPGALQQRHPPLTHRLKTRSGRTGSRLHPCRCQSRGETGQ